MTFCGMAFQNISMTVSGVNQTWNIITTAYTVQALAKCVLLTGVSAIYLLHYDIIYIKSFSPQSHKAY